MNEPSYRIGRHHPQQPHHQQNNRYSFEHCIPF
jgi:hypothetical protein